MLDDSESDAWNQVHGRIPQNRNRKNGWMSGWRFGRITVNTSVYVSSSSSGLTKLHKKPSTLPR